MSIGDRLKKYIDSIGTNVNQVTVACGLTPGALNKVLRNETKGVHSTTLEALIVNYPDLNPDWLIAGRGNMLRTSRVSHKTHQADSIGAHDGNIIALSSKVAAGLMRHDNQQEFLNRQPRISLPGERFRGRGMLAIQVTGDSMDPTVLDGDWLIVRRLLEPRRDVRPGHLYVIVTREGAAAKRLHIDFATEVIVCHSDNPAHPPYTIDEKDAMVYDVMALIRENPGDHRYSINARLVQLERTVNKLKGD